MHKNKLMVEIEHEEPCTEVKEVQNRQLEYISEQIIWSTKGEHKIGNINGFSRPGYGRNITIVKKENE